VVPQTGDTIRCDRCSDGDKLLHPIRDTLGVRASPKAAIFYLGLSSTGERRMGKTKNPMGGVVPARLRMVVNEIHRRQVSLNH